MQAFKMLRKGRRGYLRAIEVAEQKETNLNKIPMVRESASVFQEVQGDHLIEK